jgi:hypothetical protein
LLLSHGFNGRSQEATNDNKFIVDAQNQLAMDLSRQFKKSISYFKRFRTIQPTPKSLFKFKTLAFTHKMGENIRGTR